ncbi:hypothetical protein BDW69DRAFT_189793 [Aspergillus filifer]
MPRKLPLAKCLAAKATKASTTRIFISIASRKREANDENHGWIVLLTPERSIAPTRQRLWHITATTTGYKSEFEEVAVDSAMAARLFQSLHRAGWIEPSAENDFSDVLAAALGQYERRWVEVLFGEFEGIQGVARDIKSKLAIEIPVAPFEPGGELYQRFFDRWVSEEEAGGASAEGIGEGDSVLKASSGVKRKSCSDDEQAVRTDSSSAAGSPSSKIDSPPHIHFDTDSESSDEGGPEKGIVPEPVPEHVPTSASGLSKGTASSSSLSPSKSASAGHGGSPSSVQSQPSSDSDCENAIVTDPGSVAELD